MPTLRIQHAVPNYDAWKQAFDRDPMDRKGGGVLRYAVHRSVADPNFVMIDLEFGSRAEAEAFHQKLIAMWSGPAKAVMRDPQAWIVEQAESVEL